jgi:acyl-[acyl-carrier-protein]-phospholipid O-acyltransferase/long-chain-fatty-acid--[acyl-carrier-protein] ligase
VSRIYGKTGLFSRRKVIEDINRQPQTYRDILLKSYILGKKFTGFTRQFERVGMMLPNTVANVVSIFGLSAYARVPVMLNFSQGPSVVCSMCRTAEVKHVSTSKAFILKAKMQDTVSALEKEGVKIVYLENVAKKINLKDKLAGLWAYKTKKIPVEQKSSDEAVILFTSGSEGFPKAVVLSHSNVVANVQQTCCMLKLSVQDLLFNSLPMFHSFGLTVGTFFPLFTGSRVFLFPSPLLYRTITELL